jgi:hypothetical protein
MDGLQPAVMLHNGTEYHISLMKIDISVDFSNVLLPGPCPTRGAILDNGPSADASSGNKNDK